jgi:nucleoside-diphosphate-sugar epimerase
MKNILISGGFGFVGRNFIRHLLSREEGCNITVVDNLLEDKDGPKKLGNLTKYLDINIEDIRTWIPKNTRHFDLTIHLAAVVGGRQKIEGNPLSVATDLAIDADMLNAVENGLSDELIYFSSSAAYPIDKQTSECKDHLKESFIDFKSNKLGIPDMTYGWSKLTGEFLCQFLKQTKYTIFRPFSGYGEDQLPSYPFPAIMQRVYDGENPIIVWGSGQQYRDWIHIEDVINMALDLHQKYPKDVYNLGTGIETSFTDLILLAGKVMDKKFDIMPDTSKPEGVFYRVADISKTTSLGIKNKISLEEGIEKWAAIKGVK